MREDILVSIALINDGDIGETLGQVETIQQALSRRFRYFEVICVANESLRASFDNEGEKLSGFTNLRIILVSDPTRYHQRRVIAASEAIGDVVALVDPEDFGAGQICELAEQCKDRNEILIGWGKASGLTSYARHVLSAVSRHNLAAEAMRSIILPRQRLNEILARSSAVLDLRFEPSNAIFKYKRTPVANGRRRNSSLAQRYELLTEILIAGAPRYLKIYAASAFVVSFFAVFYAIYAILIISLRSDVQPGWFSNAMVQSGSVIFIAIGMSVLSLAMAGLIERLTGGENQAISGEISNIDFFDRHNDLNVELGSSFKTGEDSGHRDDD